MFKTTDFIFAEEGTSLNLGFSLFSSTCVTKFAVVFPKIPLSNTPNGFTERLFVWTAPVFWLNATIEEASFFMNPK
ncbi:hypothetical protein D3C86_1253090 [compost metagenome]